MDRPLRRLTPDDYTVAYICPMGIELAPVKAMLDERHQSLPTSRDLNSYSLGRIGEHNVVIAVMPEIGNNQAATVATQLLNEFRSIRFGLLVGIAGGIPWIDKYDIRLGDVVVSKPTDVFGGVVQFDRGKVHTDARFERTGALAKPPKILQATMENLKAEHELTGNQLSRYLAEMFDKFPIMEDKYGYPGTEFDQLFEADYHHNNRNTCGQCDQGKIVNRTIRKIVTPRIHYGTIGSSNLVIKDGVARDQLKDELGILCVDMEAAGLTDEFSCLVIRGICDYADSHKNKRWQAYAAATAAAYAKEVLSIIPAQELITTNKVTSTLSEVIWLVPFGRNRNFVGRYLELEELLVKLDVEGPEDGCRRVAIAGLGGVGKTQIALEAAFRIQKLSRRCSIFWISAASVASFERAFRDIGAALRLLDNTEGKSDAKLLVKNYLSQEYAGKWLLIVDNADDVEMLYKRGNEGNESGGSPALADYLPSSRKGMILFTTRNLRAAVNQAEVDIILIKEMSESDSWKLLQASLIDKSMAGEKDAMAKLLDNLTYLPLAIKQAAAYMNQNTISILDYLALYEAGDDNFVRLLSADFEDQGRYREVKNAIASTWLISFRQISSYDPLAEEYLCFMSCIAQQDVPHALLPQVTETKKLEAIGTLRAYSLITKRDGQDSYDVHRLVQIVMRNWLKSRGEIRLWGEKALMQVAKVFPYPEYENRAIWATYLPHAQAVLSSQDFSSDFEESQQGLLLCRIGQCFHRSGNYVEAEKFYHDSLELTKKALGLEHSFTLNVMGKIARSLGSQGKHVEAEKMGWQILALSRKVLGHEHKFTLTTMNNLAQTLRRQGKYAEGEKIHRETLELDKKVSGHEHPDTLTSMTGLASALSSQGKYVEAEKMHRQILALKTKILGPMNTYTLTSMNELAKTLGKQNKYAEAEEMLQQTLELVRKALGIEHPKALTSMSELAKVLTMQGKYAEGEKIHLETLELDKKVLGLEHPNTLINMNNLAMALEEQKKYGEAEILYQQLLEIRGKVLGRKHPSTLHSMKHLAAVLRQQGKSVEAQEIHAAYKSLYSTASAS